MALEAWKKVFVFLLVLCGTLLVTMRIGYQVDITSLHGYLWKYLASNDSERPMRGLTRKSAKLDANSLFVFPGRSSMAFESSPVLRYFYRLPQSHHPSDKHRVHQWLNDSLPDLSTNKSESKLILFFNPPSWIGRKVISYCRLGLNMCPIKSCRCSINGADLEKADAVIVDAPYLTKGKPIIKKTSQVWIFFTLESPGLGNSSRYKDQWRQMFNWTYTYRLDSDIAKPNDMLFHRPVLKNYTSMAQKKTKSAVWLVSHCKTHSKRELFVKELKKYYDVDIFGGCGKRTKLSDATLLKPYRFYLAFENSFCFDYITEKLFKTYAADINIIPVVRGGADYDSMIPNGTYINAAHFNTPKELGKYLLYLEKNVTAYAEYLQENDQFVNEGREPGYQISFCEICVKMHNLKLYGNSYTDIGKWYREGICKSPTDI